jgi:hypothetical protein
MRRACGVLLWIACAGAVFLHAQEKKSIIIEVRDGKTGQVLAPSNVQVRFDHQSAAGASWVDQKEDGTIEVTLPRDAKVIAVRTTYMNSLEYYVNCDVAKQRDVDGETWYPVGDIVASGIAVPNDCVRQKEADKIKVNPKPGELILYVRKRNWREQE